MFFALVMSLFVLGACGGSNSPKDVAKEVVECLKEKDFEGYAEMVHFTSENSEEVEAQKKMIVSMLQDKYAKTVEKKGGIVSYEILSEEIEPDGNKAVVGISIKYGNGDVKEDNIKLVKDGDGKWKVDAGK